MKLIAIIFGIALLVFGLLNLTKKESQNLSNNSQSLQTQSESQNSQLPKIEIIAQNLDTPWALAFLPDNNILVTERQGKVRLVENGTLINEPVAVISSVKEIGEGGLLGMTLDPDFSSNHLVYLYYTYQANGNDTLNRVVSMEYKDKKLSNEKTLIDKIPGASNHNGGRIKFGPDKFLYISTGDAQEPSLAQDKHSLAGKILRVSRDGKAPTSNPFNNLVYSYGHRNSQGLAWDDTGTLWATEHGRSGLQSGLDEINIISPGKNYGWPTIQGDEQKTGLETPYEHSGSNTWAPAGADFLNGSIYFAGLRGTALYRLQKNTHSVEEFLEGEFGRLRDVVASPDGMLYITTSNKDGRGLVKQGDDKIIRINPSLL